MNSGAALLAAFGSFLAQQAATNDENRIQIEARLFLESTGELSKNLLERSDSYSGWNDGLFAAPARGRLWGSGDILVVTSVDTTSKDRNDYADDLRVLITNKGKVLADRTVRLSAGRKVMKVPVWLTDVTCAGPIRIEAIYRDERKAASLNMSCGE